MRDMFYNYEHNIADKEYPPMKPKEPHKHATDFSGADLIYNIKGDILGIRAKIDQPFRLYFYLDGEVEDGSITELMSEAVFYIQIYHNKSNELLGELKADTDIDNTLVAQIDPAEFNMSYGVYRLKLIMNYNMCDYELFSRDSSILSIE